ncbi:glycosyltransferase [Aquisalimonas sp.]|uniref:glycosyltransferase n=1 Tax=Aquisalimonas sp. TaxID=1872621 RepID=UPI0025C0186F|nr:glycosyltransferase [Aquisalimonas sp.]
MKITFFLSQYGQGGVERMLINTAHGLANRAHDVAYLTPGDGAFMSTLPASVEHVPLPGKRGRHRAALVDHLTRTRPEFLIVGKDDDAATALRAKRAAASPVKVVVRPGTTISRRLAGRSAFKRWRVYRALRLTYRQADGVVANSQGVREDISRITGLSVGSIYLIRNPVITPGFEEAARARAVHPWFADGEPPVLLGAGGLRRQKDFPTLVHAFSLVRQQQSVRLVILGRGHLERSLQQQARRLGVEADVLLPGFVENPYPWMQQAGVFVLSSLWEGSPNVLTEALALGIPVVATDCPSGPNEILQHGRYGRLTPPGNSEALASAIIETLKSPLPAETLRKAAAEYTMERTAQGYEAMLREILEPARRDWGKPEASE